MSVESRSEWKWLENIGNALIFVGLFALVAWGWFKLINLFTGYKSFKWVTIIYTSLFFGSMILDKILENYSYQVIHHEYTDQIISNDNPGDTLLYFVAWVTVIGMFLGAIFLMIKLYKQQKE